jgi:hypothetical protein
MATPSRQDELNLDALSESIREPLTLLADSLRASLAQNLAGITVVGSALTDDYRAGTSDINTVVLLSQHDTAALNSIAAMAKSMRKKHISAPLLMTKDYIERSRDVFGVEFLDFQLTHETILGDDPFASLNFEKAEVRLQCERELKATLIRLRQGYIAAAGNKNLVRDVLIATAKALAPLLRALLWLKDIERPQTMTATFQNAASEFSVGLEAVIAAEHWRYDKPRLTDSDIEAAFESIYATADNFAQLVDAMEVA